MNGEIRTVSLKVPLPRARHPPPSAFLLQGPVLPGFLLWRGCPPCTLLQLRGRSARVAQLRCPAALPGNASARVVHNASFAGTWGERPQWLSSSPCSLSLSPGAREASMAMLSDRRGEDGGEEAAPQEQIGAHTYDHV